ncbi:hypothetical protein DSO57_1017047 [Entomophthora muscae]|uniref:Uncharacterized protein n=1 Tax=Entomophthora muscae TaxID=34485 RepID=A0ACC2SHN7_9FUNG|nr:hypothetical protein DSO57_1017047 [Entomophthora muscae]
MRMATGSRDDPAVEARQAYMTREGGKYRQLHSFVLSNNSLWVIPSPHFSEFHIGSFHPDPEPFAFCHQSADETICDKEIIRQLWTPPARVVPQSILCNRPHGCITEVQIPQSENLIVPFKDINSPLSHLRETASPAKIPGRTVAFVTSSYDSISWQPIILAIDYIRSYNTSSEYMSYRALYNLLLPGGEMDGILFYKYPFEHFIELPKSYFGGN